MTEDLKVANAFGGRPIDQHFFSADHREPDMPTILAAADEHPHPTLKHSPRQKKLGLSTIVSSASSPGLSPTRSSHDTFYRDVQKFEIPWKIGPPEGVGAPLDRVKKADADWQKHEAQVAALTESLKKAYAKRIEILHMRSARAGKHFEEAKSKMTNSQRQREEHMFLLRNRLDTWQLHREELHKAWLHHHVAHASAHNEDIARRFKESIRAACH